MKKFFSLLLVAVLLSAMLVVPASADDYFWSEGEYTLDDSGNWHPNNAWGYVFNIDALNTLTVDGNAAITGIFTNVEDYLANAGGKNAQWKAHIILAPTEEANVYEVVQGYEYTGKTAQAAVNEGIVNFDGGKIILMASDSGTRPEKKDGALLFPNWEDRAACWGLVKTVGAKLTLAGINLKAAAGACTGTLTVEAEPKADDENDEDDNVVVVHTNVAQGKKFTTHAPLGGYNANITDGVKSDKMAYSGDVWYAFKCHPTDASGNTDGKRFGTVVIDLEDTYTLSEVKINAIYNDGSGISLCSDAKVYLSDDGETWGKAIALGIPEESGLSANSIYTIGGTVNGSARYVKFELTLGEKTFLFFDEIEVYGGKGAQTPGTSTPDVSTPDVSTPDASTPETSDKEDTEPGDASNMIIFAIIALVAMAGSAVVIKTRK